MRDEAELPTKGHIMNGKVVALAVSALEVAVYLVSVVVTGIVAGAVTRAVEELDTTGGITGAGVAADILQVMPADALLGWILVDAVIVLIHLDDLRGTGAPPSRNGRAGFGGLILLVLAVQVGALALVRWTGLDAGWLVITETGEQDFLAGSDIPTALIILAVLLHPIAVEVFFRGELMHRLRAAGFGTAPVVLVPAVLFALVQPSWVLAAVGLVFGVAVGTVHLRTRSLLPAIVSHILFLVAGVVAWQVVPGAGQGDVVPVVFVVLSVLATALALWMLWPRHAEEPWDEPARTNGAAA